MKNKFDFCEKIKECEHAMYALAYSVVRNEHDAGEVLSESIYRAYRSLDTLKDEKAFRSWMLKIVHNTAVEFVRKSSHTVEVWDIDESYLVEDCHAEQVALKMTLKAAVGRLKQPYRTVVVLFYYENLSIAEIGKITGQSVMAVKQQLSRARKMLKEDLKEDFKDE